MRNKEQAAMTGSGVAAAGDGGVEAGDPDALSALKGHSIRMVRWVARSFGAPEADQPPPPPSE